jgi:hypothetical protein
MGGSVYTLNTSEVAKFNLQDASSFVNLWNQFYGYEASLPDDKKQLIDYLSELSLGRDLNDQNVRRLLRWKDPRFLTDPKKRTNQPNAKVRMRRAAEGIFESPKIVWRVFLLHIAKPHMYPIADQNVFRSYRLHTGKREPRTWDEYAAYRHYFERIADQMQIARTRENIQQLKRVDNALFVFGQFLAAYYKPKALATDH